MFYILLGTTFIDKTVSPTSDIINTTDIKISIVPTSGISDGIYISNVQVIWIVLHSIVPQDYQMKNVVVVVVLLVVIIAVIVVIILLLAVIYFFKKRKPNQPVTRNKSI